MDNLFTFKRSSSTLTSTTYREVEFIAELGPCKPGDKFDRIEINHQTLTVSIFNAPSQKLHSINCTLRYVTYYSYFVAD